MPPPEILTIHTRDDLAAALLHFINEELPKLDRRGQMRQPVSLGTSLFEEGRLDSLSILHLLARLEELTGRRIPDELVVMKHFRSVETITATFWEPLTS